MPGAKKPGISINTALGAKNKTKQLLLVFFVVAQSRGEVRNPSQVVTCKHFSVADNPGFHLISGSQLPIE